MGGWDSFGASVQMADGYFPGFSAGLFPGFSRCFSLLFAAGFHAGFSPTLKRSSSFQRHSSNYYIHIYSSRHN
jgi:hypothetical protein